MAYDPEIPKLKYNNDGDSEWIRLEKDAKGELLYAVHLEMLRRHVRKGDRVLEIGAGSGRYTKDLVDLCGMLTVADLSDHQIACNKARMRERGLLERIEAYHVLDVLDMGIFPDGAFDCVVCIGGVIDYLLDREADGMAEMLRVLRPGGTLIVGAMSFIGASFHFLHGIQQEKETFGIEATRWVFDTGIQDEAHYPVASRHYVHMMRSSEMDALFARFPLDILERSAAGLFTQAGDLALESARQDAAFWKLIVEKEVAWTKLPGTLDCGMNIIYAARKRGA